MTGLGQSSTLEQYRLAGEDAPNWLILAFTLIGIFMAVATAWLLTGQVPWQEKPLATEEAHYASPKPVKSVSPAEPIQTSAQSLPVNPAETGSKSNPPPSLADANNSQATPAGVKGQGEGSSPKVLGRNEIPAMPVDNCPPNVTILFKSGKARLIADEEGKLEPLRQWLGKHPKARLLVDGYADSVGEEQSNLILSYQRAKAVAALLKKMGIPPEQLSIRAAGEHPPIPGLPANAADYRQAYLQIEGSENCQNPSTGRAP